MYLVDTNVLSIRASGRRERPAFLVEWMDAHSDELFLSAITVTEISHGNARVRRTGASSRAANLGEWLETVLHLYGSLLQLPLQAAI